MDVHSLMLSIQHFLCPLQRRPPSKVPGGMVFGEAVVACDVAEPCVFLCLDSRQKRFLWTNREVDLAPHPVFGLVLKVGDAEKFPQALWSRQPGSSFQSQQ